MNTISSTNNFFKLDIVFFFFVCYNSQSGASAAVGEDLKAGKRTDRRDLRAERKGDLQ